ncbi:MAG: cytochrome b/b6 domain-containing protein, partial [Neisseria sp.]|nr:cytochrome b/b6 domain-containing protein [Neisseria sp.]
MKKIKVWDWQTRFFHWSLATSLAFMWFSAEQGGDWLVWHLRCGLWIFALLIFRLCWGIWGSESARFAQFVQPHKIPAYFAGKLSPKAQLGHNPLGALMVVALLLILSIQVVSGLFTADENTFINHGFLNHLVSTSFADGMRAVHFINFNIVLLLAAIHIATIFFYKWIKKNNLITPMLTGY